MTNVKTKTRTRVNDRTDIDSMSKWSLALMASVSALVGTWGVACLAGALFNVGPVALIKGFCTAVFGM